MLARLTYLTHSTFKLVVFAALTVLLTAFVVWVDPWLDQGDPLTVKALNAWPMAAVLILLLAITKRPALSLLTAMALTATVFYINHIKLTELSQPLLLTDLMLFPQVIGHMDLLGAYVNTNLFVALWFAWLSACVLFWTSEPPWFQRTGQITGIVVAMGMWAFVASPWGLSWYEQNTGPNRPWAPIEEIKTQGLVAAAVRAAHTQLVSLPEPDLQKINELKNALAQAWTDVPFDPAARPDLIVILSESFFESRYLTNAEPCILLPNWCALLEEGQWGEMSVPTFGGNTTRTEYEVLTGVPYRSLPQGVYPYNSIVLQPTASIAWWLKSLGYETTAIHPHDRYFWQRHRAMPLLGFDRFIGEQEFGPHTRSGFWISDKDLTNKVIQTLEKTSDTPQFVFAISMENHGPWHAKRPNMDEERRASLPSIKGLEGPGAHAYRNYLYHQRQAVDALNTLWQYAKTRARPTAILFFGDHLPGLHDTFRQLNFEQGFEPLTHPVPYLFLQTEPKSPPSWQPDTSYQLGLWLLEANALPIPSDYALLSAEHQRVEESDAPDQSALYPHLIRLDPNLWALELCERDLVC